MFSNPSWHTRFKLYTNKQYHKKNFTCHNYIIPLFLNHQKYVNMYVLYQIKWEYFCNINIVYILLMVYTNTAN